MPKNVDNIFEISLIYKNSLANYDKALEYLQKAIEINPNHKLSYNTIGNIYNTKLKYELAEFNFKKSI